MLVRRSLLLLVLAGSLCAACDNVTCKTNLSPASAACIPPTLAPDTNVRIELRELCGRNCARNPVCEATIAGGVVVLDIHAESCNDVLINNCAPCQQRIYSCKLPPLPVGDYTLRAPGMSDQLLRVRAGGTNACALANPDGGV